MSEDTIPEGLGVRMSSLEGAYAEVGDQLKALTTAIGTLGKGVKHNRRVTRVVIVSLAFDILLSLGFGVAFLQARTADHHAAATGAALAVQVVDNQTNLHNTCVTSNQTRALATQSWDYVLGELVANQPAAAQAATQALRNHIDALFVPQNCK